MTPSLPTCATCGSTAADVLFVPELAAARYAVAVCRRHDLMGDGERVPLAEVAASPRPYLLALDGTEVEPDDALRGWMVEAANGGDRATSGLLTTAQAATYLGVRSAETVRRAIRARKLKAIRLNGGPYRIKVADLDRYEPQPQRAERDTATRSDVGTRRRASKSVAW